MDTTLHKEQEHSSSRDDGQQKIAVPYVPPPAPDESEQKRFRSPLINGIIIALVILLGGFMTYNFLGYKFTQLAGESAVHSVSPTPSVSPTDTPVPSVAISPTTAQ